MKIVFEIINEWRKKYGSKEYTKEIKFELTSAPKSDAAAYILLNNGIPKVYLNSN